MSGASQTNIIKECECRLNGQRMVLRRAHAQTDTNQLLNLDLDADAMLQVLKYSNTRACFGVFFSFFLVDKTRFAILPLRDLEPHLGVVFFFFFFANTLQKMKMSFPVPICDIASRWCRWCVCAWCAWCRWCRGRPVISFPLRSLDSRWRWQTVWSMWCRGVWGDEDNAIVMGDDAE